MTSREEHLTAVAGAAEAVVRAREHLSTAVETRATALRAAHDAGITWRELGDALSLSGKQVELASLPRKERAARRRPRDR